MPGMTVFPLETYFCLFCCCKIYLCIYITALVCCCILKFDVTIACRFTLQVWSSALAAHACLSHSFDFIDTQCIWHGKFGSAVALSKFILCVDVIYIPEAFINCLPLCTSMCYHNIFQLPTDETIHYCIVVGTFH